MSDSDTPQSQHDLSQFEPAGETKGEYLSDIIRLPGYWPVDEECEQYRPTGFCENGHPQLGSREPCGTRQCPLHWYQWRRRAVTALVARLAAYRYLQGDRNDPARRLLHTVTSPPQDQRWTVSRFWEQRPDAYDAMEAVGGRGGVAFPHPYGVSEEGEELWDDALDAGLDPAYGKWRLERDNADEWSEMQELVEVHPHFHQITPVQDLDGEAVEEQEAETGWTVNNVRSMERFYIDANEALPELTQTERVKARKSSKSDLEAFQELAEEKAMAGYEDMARLAMYLLSHSAVQPETGDLPMRHTVSYWGEVHSLNVEEEIENGSLTREEWETIKQYAKAAVGGEIRNEEGEEIAAENTCSREDCDARVHPLTELKDWLARPEWLNSLDHDRACEIWGLKLYMSDRPPPGTGPPLSEDELHDDEEPRVVPPGGFERSAESYVPDDLTEKEEFISWLRRIGRRRIDQNPFYFGEAGV